jgi:hypothetical protein
MDTIDSKAALLKYHDEFDRLIVAMDLAFGAGAASNGSSPEDFVVFPLGVAARNLFEEIHFLVSQGYGDAAVRTSRTLYECVVFALYINKHPETWSPYLETMYASWANVLRSVSDPGGILPEMHQVLSEKFPKYVERKHVSLNWNDEGHTFAMAADVGVSGDFHSLAFGYTSAFVHPSASFILGRITQLPEEKRFLFGTKRNDNAWRIALQIAHDLMITSIRLRTKYSDSQRLRESVTLCGTDFSNIWGYTPQSSKQPTTCGSFIPRFQARCEWVSKPRDRCSGF